MKHRIIQENSASIAADFNAKALPKRKTNRGSTLYEIVVALALIAIITTMSTSAVLATRNYIDQFNATNERLNDLTNLREAVTVWFDSFPSDQYSYIVIPVTKEEGSETYTVVFLPSESMDSLPDEAFDLASLSEIGYYLTFSSGSLAAHSPSESKVLTTSSYIQSISFLIRDGTALVRCEIFFNDGESSVFMLRRHT